jgi:hypothetical protein
MHKNSLNLQSYIHQPQIFQPVTTMGKANACVGEIGLHCGSGCGTEASHLEVSFPKTL